MKKVISGLFFELLFLIAVGRAMAAEEGGNKFGIHVLEPADLARAQELVNSNGGDWGWVTVVIRDDDRSQGKWQGFMDECRERHLMPLVRIATHLEGANWAAPKEEEAAEWADFLASLNWPAADRYVILFNEPNQTKEWGGTVSPEKYTRIWLAFREKLKEKNEHFLVLNAGLDLAAGKTKITVGAAEFLRRMAWEKPGIFNEMDGWVSHSYPNHGYLGKPWESGQHSVRGYEWELAFLKKELGLVRDLPVFITETGWPKGGRFYDEATAAEYIKRAFEEVWLKDGRVRAVTPFVLNYPAELFASFSWLDDEGLPYPQFEVVKGLEKTAWRPEQEERIVLGPTVWPPFLVAGDRFEGKLVLENQGQSIWGDRGPWLLRAKESEVAAEDLIISTEAKVKPGEKVTLSFVLQAPEKSGEFVFGWEGLEEQKIKVLPSGFISRVRFGFWKEIIWKAKRLFFR